MIAEAAEHPRIGAQTGQFPNGLIQRIASFGDQVASHYGEMGAEFVRHIDDPAGLAHGEERTDMKVADLDDAEAFQVRMKIGDGEVDFLHVKLGAFDNAAESDPGKRRGDGNGTGGAQQTPAFRGELSFLTTNRQPDE